MAVARPRAWALAAALSLSMTSCGPDELAVPGPVPVPSTPPTLEIDVGTGATEFVDLADEVPVELVHGVQGGFHVWTGIRVHDERFSDVQVNLSTRFEDGTPAGPASSTVTTLGAAREGARSAAGLRNFIGNAEAVRGKRIVLRVEVITKDQQHGAAERVVSVIAK